MRTTANILDCVAEVLESSNPLTLIFLDHCLRNLRWFETNDHGDLASKVVEALIYLESEGDKPLYSLDVAAYRLRNTDEAARENLCDRINEWSNSLQRDGDVLRIVKQPAKVLRIVEPPARNAPGHGAVCRHGVESEPTDPA